MYDEVEDEKKGSNKIVMVNDKFDDGEVVDIKMSKKDMDPLHGFSTFAFVLKFTPKLSAKETIPSITLYIPPLGCQVPRPKSA